MFGPAWLCLALLLAAPPCGAITPQRATTPQASLKPLYPAIAPAWTATLSGALSNLPAARTHPLLGRLSELPARSQAQARAAAPLIRELVEGLGYDPLTFSSTLSPAEQTLALGMAAEDAAKALQKQSYERVDAAKALVFSERSVSGDGRRELWRLVAELGEIEAHYGLYLDRDERELVASAHTQAAARAWEIQTQLVSANARREAEALLGPAGVRHAVAAHAPASRREPTASAVKILEDMKHTKEGWGQDDFETLYLGYGFERREGAKHVVYQHPEFPHLHQTVSRGKNLARGYAHAAIKMVRELEALQAPAALAAAPSPARAASRAALPPKEVMLRELGLDVAALDARAELPEPAPQAAGARQDEAAAPFPELVAAQPVPLLETTLADPSAELSPPDAERKAPRRAETPAPPDPGAETELAPPSSERPRTLRERLGRALSFLEPSRKP